MICAKCNHQTPPGKFCSNCAAPLELEENLDFGSNAEESEEGEDEVGPYDDSVRYLKYLSYIGILAVVPLLLPQTKNDPLVKLHANQGLNLALISIAWAFLQSPIRSLLRLSLGPTVTGMIMAVLGLINLAVFIIAIIGTLRVHKEDMTPFPVLDAIQLVK